MPLTLPASGGGSGLPKVPAGSHIAVCDIVADLGMQPGSALYPKPKRQVVIRFEIPAERVEYEKDGKKMIGPAVISKTYTASMNEKATLRKHLESWRGKSFTDDEAEKFDISAILGKPCMLTVMHSQKGENTYANIMGMGPLPKGINAKEMLPEIDPIYYAADDTSKLTLLPPWIQEKIQKQIRPELERPDTDDGAELGNALEDGSYITDSDIPF